MTTNLSFIIVSFSFDLFGTHRRGKIRSTNFEIRNEDKQQTEGKYDFRNPKFETGLDI